MILDLLKKQFGPEHEKVAGMYMHLGINYYKTGQFERAEQLLLQAKQIFEKVLDPNSENWNRIYNNMIPSILNLKIANVGASALEDGRSKVKRNP